jgi:hypothetical protein
MNAQNLNHIYRRGALSFKLDKTRIMILGGKAAEEVYPGIVAEEE